MHAPTIADYLKYASLQMAAEAFIRDEETNILRDSNEDLTDALKEGNKHTSRFPESEARKFADTWEVLDQRANTPTGFSGTLFRRVRDDPATGAKAGELVLSFRSTEFIDDTVRDNEATNVKEIKETGWAWGQIADMETWYDELRRDPGKLQGQTFSVTGYSLGGHLATAFHLPHSDDVKEVVTFNGAGVGKVKSGGFPDGLRAALEQTITASLPGDALRRLGDQSYWPLRCASQYDLVAWEFPAADFLPPLAANTRWRLAA
ncbi:MAG: hypothetical protein HWD57_14310 [Candidatus Accumulibacter cognatus]|uniref:Fungal lipase-like domain-containing protein n=1 Tax=Candidatus Accumulibacter cognatus TaxID=2954383 RepID=A0A7D5ND58_9PROT|nr:MAG: hypothetical protein HWD57_14310 [Candidatus Accumulibacter cognatus]